MNATIKKAIHILESMTKKQQHFGFIFRHNEIL